jgi:tRNA-splicing ligase RtcB
VRERLERLRAEEDVVRVAVMPDVHLAEEVCVGTVVATRRRLLPAAVGGDIGCGVSALRFETPRGGATGAVAARSEALLALLQRLVPIHKHAVPPPLPEALARARLRGPGLDRLLAREGRLQLGTIGRGNHFLELQADPQDALWVMVHTGSRALGPAVQAAHAPGGGPGRHLAGLEADSESGRAWLADHDLALAFAQASRERILEAAGAVLLRVLGCEPDLGSFLDCCHNLVRREDHGEGPVWVHRKGAIPAAAGQRGIIPGSMGTPTFLVEGRGCPEALGSSSHGAGRQMSRSEARSRISAEELRRQLGPVCFDAAKAACLCEEAPAAYKDIRRVMRAQRELTRVVSEHRPLLCHKGTCPPPPPLPLLAPLPRRQP